MAPLLGDECDVEGDTFAAEEEEVEVVEVSRSFLVSSSLDRMFSSSLANLDFSDLVKACP